MSPRFSHYAAATPDTMLFPRAMLLLPMLRRFRYHDAAVNNV